KSNPSNSTCPPLATACGMLVYLAVSDRYGLLRRQFAAGGLRIEVLAFLDDAGGTILLLQLQRLGYRQPVGEAYGGEAGEDLADQHRQDDGRLEVGGEGQVIAQQEGRADAEGDIQHLVLRWHEAHQAEHGEDVGDGCQHAGAAHGAQADLAAQGLQRTAEVLAQQIDHREGTGQHDADVACGLQRTGLVFGIGDDRVEAPAAQDDGEKAGEVFDDGKHQYQLDQRIHAATEGDEALDHHV